MKKLLNFLVIGVIVATVLTPLVLPARASAAPLSFSDLSIPDQAYMYESYTYMNYDNNFTCANQWSTTIDIVSASQWKLISDNTSANRSSIVIGDSLSCANGGWLSKVWGKLGYTDPVQLLLDLGYTKRTTDTGVSFTYWMKDTGYVDPGAGAIINTSPVKDAVWRIFKEKYGSIPTLTDSARFYLYNYAFVNASGCNGQRLEPYNASDDLQKTKIIQNGYFHFYDLDGKEYVWSSARGAGANVTVGYNTVEGSPSVFELSCQQLVDKMSGDAGQKLATAYAQNISANPTKGTGTIGDGVNDAAVNGDVCGFSNNALNWIACPLTMLMQTAATTLADKLGDLLYFPASNFFETGTPGNAELKEAWGHFRDIGLALVVIAGLVMVISQALGLEFLDAYTIRKLMPRLAIAIIGIALSWPILNIVISFFNDLGSWTRGLIIMPFQGLPVAESGTGNIALNYGVILLGTPALLVYLWVLGPLAVLSLFASVLLAVFIGLIVLAVRWVVIALCILLAPLAIAAYVLPGTQKLWKFWKNTLLTSLTMFPIIMGLIAAGDAMARVATALDKTNYFFILLLYFAPYFMLPMAFKMAGGLMSTIFSMTNDKSRGVFDRMRNFRQNSAKKRWGEYQSSLRGSGPIGSRVSDLAVAQKALSDPGIGLNGLREKDGLNRARGKYSEHAVMGALKDNSLAWTADDSANGALFDTQGKGGKSAFRAAYVKRAQASGSVDPEHVLHEKADEAYQDILAGVGAQKGSKALEAAAWKSLQYSKTGYSSSDEGLAQRIKDTETAVARGYINKNEAGAWQKQSQRLTASQVSYSDWLKILDGGYYEEGPNGQKEWVELKGQGATDFAMKSVRNYMNPAALQSARKEDVEAIGRHLNKDLVASAARASSDNASEADIKAVAQNLAQYSGMRDVLNQTQPYLAGIFAEQLSGAQLVNASGQPIVINSAPQVTTAGSPVVTGGEQPVSATGTEGVAQGQSTVVIGSGGAATTPLAAPAASPETRQLGLSVRRLEDALKANDPNILGEAFGKNAEKVMAAWLDLRREWGTTDITSRGNVPPEVRESLMRAASGAPEQPQEPFSPPPAFR